MLASFSKGCEILVCRGILVLYGCVGSDTEPPVAGAATEPPLPLAVDVPQFVTIAIVTHDNEVLDNLGRVGPVGLNVNNIGTDHR